MSSNSCFLNSCSSGCRALSGADITTGTLSPNERLPPGRCAKGPYRSSSTLVQVVSGPMISKSCLRLRAWTTSSRRWRFDRRVLSFLNGLRPSGNDVLYARRKASATRDQIIQPVITVGGAITAIPMTVWRARMLFATLGLFLLLLCRSPITPTDGVTKAVYSHRRLRACRGLRPSKFPRPHHKGALPTRV
jgi:hypothetical protein